MKHVRAFTYEPKIADVRDGRIKQTIRFGHNFNEGDEILFHGWLGRPYKDGWSWRLRVFLDFVEDIYIFKQGMVLSDRVFYLWSDLHILAINDGIECIEGHNIGESLGMVINDMAKQRGIILNSFKGRNQIHNGVPANVIRWGKYEDETPKEDV